MITLTNHGKMIKFSLTDEVHLSFNKDTNEDYYKVELPEIICSNRQDAKHIQQEINRVANQLIRELLS